MNLFQVAEEISRRLANIFLKDKDGRRPVYGGTETFQKDPHWRECLQFFEYFHGDNGAGLGASHQTGWTGVIARTMHLFATMKADETESGKRRTSNRNQTVGWNTAIQVTCVEQLNQREPTSSNPISLHGKSDESVDQETIKSARLSISSDAGRASRVW
jgi:hypothetical protein